MIVDERNFDWRRFPTSWAICLVVERSWGRAKLPRGIDARTNVQRYTLNFTQPHLFGYSRIGFGVGGFLFTRQFRDWTEQRLAVDWR